MIRVYYKDIFRSIQKGWKRFLSIVIITALGVAMMTGLYAACQDMYATADKFYDKQNLFDIRILSTMGLTKEDVSVLSQIEGVKTAEGGYSETVDIKDVHQAHKSAEVVVLSNDKLNSPYLLEGKLPQKSGEIAVTSKYLSDNQKKIGDAVLLDINSQNTTKTSLKQTNNEEKVDLEQIDIITDWEGSAKSSFLLNDTYTITGIIIDPMEIRNREGNTGNFRVGSLTDYTFFITADDVRNNIYTAVHLTLTDTKGLNSFSNEYKDRVSEIVFYIEDNIKSKREKARYNAFLAETTVKIQDAEISMSKEFLKADEKFDNAWKEIEKGENELAQNESLLAEQEKNMQIDFENAKKELYNARLQLTEAENALNSGEKELTEKQENLNQNKQELAKKREDLEIQFAADEQKFLEQEQQLKAAQTESEDVLTMLKTNWGESWPAYEWNSFVNIVASQIALGADEQAVITNSASEKEALITALPSDNDDIVQLAFSVGEIQGNQQKLKEQKELFSNQKSSALQELDSAEKELNFGEQQIQEAFSTIHKNRKEWEQSKAKLQESENILQEEENNAYQMLQEGRKEIGEGRTKLEEVKDTFKKEKENFLEQRKKAEQKINDAYAKLETIEDVEWYVQDRTSLESYSSLKSDLSSIEAVGKVFPLIFLFVAVLMSLTSMTRMVEEERSRIGTYKALGYSNLDIYKKYLIFAFAACFFGGVLGDVLGFVFMPEFISIILEEMYILPDFLLQFDIPYGLGSIMLFMSCIVGATFLACRNELSQVPAVLMRPKSPPAGTRVLLEYIPVLWNRFKFLNKVTVRNLFRYKKRLIMTVVGIAGCTALILCGFAIRDSMLDLAPKQYEEIYQYDLMAAWKEKDNEKLMGQMRSDENITNLVNLRIDSMNLINEKNESEKIQLIVIPNQVSLEKHIKIMNLDNVIIEPDNKGILVTQNAAQLLNIKTNSQVFLQDKNLILKSVPVSNIVKNYLGNNVYISQELYESVFGNYVPNGVLCDLYDSVLNHREYSEALLENNSVLSSISTAALMEDFSFDLIDAVVLLIIVMAGSLAFVVLFTLSTTNISERVRELATIKVLGFYDYEVHQYINKETIILTLMGILLGLPVGRIISELLTAVLKMPSIYFAAFVSPVSYLISTLITLIFALIVNQMTHRALNKIDMVEALKSVE